MSRTDLVEAAERILKPIQQFSRGWMLDRTTAEFGVSLGLRTGEEYWIVGRAGALGDVDAEIAAAGLAFIAPGAVREAWEHIPPGMTPSTVAATYAGRCTEWGTETLAEFDPDRMERLDRLGRRIADGASPALGVLFAAWRSVDQPEDAGARAMLTMQVLREMPRRRPHHRHPGVRPHPGRGHPRLAGTGATLGGAVGRAPRLARSVPRSRGGAGGRFRPNG